jgi:omega-amidase
MEDISLTLIQTPLYWEDPVANLAMLEEKLWQLQGEQEIILLPEMFTTGFTMNAASLAEPMGLTTFRWMKQQSERMSAIIAGSFIAKEDGQYYNRFLWMRPDGSYDLYDKRHLFRMAREEQVFTAGKQRLVVTHKGWRICPMVCYDLRFPIWSRNSYLHESERMDYDILLYVANWPAPRKLAWESLLRGRAIENLCYCAGVNRIGKDGNNIRYDGMTMAIDPKGQTLVSFDDREEVNKVVFSWKELSDYRLKFPAYLDADEFHLE